MRIALIVEGETERVFLGVLKGFLAAKLPGRTPRVDSNVFHGRIPTGDKLRRVVARLLAEFDAVIALTDVYTGARDFADAADAKNKMRQWVGTEPRFYPHAAQYDFEAWLLPYWEEIRRLSGTNRKSPAENPESVNHMSPPAHRIAEAFRTGTKRTYYNKPIHAKKILDGKDLSVAAAKCRELRELLNTLITLGGGAPVFK